jgi:hypothetical protein
MDGFKAFLRVRKARAMPCLADATDLPLERLYARLTPLSQSVSNAYAAPVCAFTLIGKVDEVIARADLDQAQKKLMISIGNKMLGTADDLSGALKVSEQTLDIIAGFVKNGHGESILALLNNMEDLSIPMMGRFRFDTMSKAVNEVSAFDSLFDAMKYLPEDSLIKAFNQLAAKNQSNIRGIYGEARTFKDLKANPNLTREDGSGFEIDPDRLKVGGSVNTPLARNVQGVDIEGLLVDVSSTGITSQGGKLFVEVKNYTSSYKKSSVLAQTKKHFQSNILAELDQVTGTWKGQKPQLHYQWMGDAFDTPAKVNTRKEWVIEACKSTMKRFGSTVFDCDKDISFRVLPEIIDPLTTKGT